MTYHVITTVVIKEMFFPLFFLPLCYAIQVIWERINVMEVDIFPQFKVSTFAHFPSLHSHKFFFLGWDFINW